MRKGFTLIEVLVVVAIIGILAAVVLTSLNNTRDKASDARIKAEARSIINEAELYYSNNGEVYEVDEGICEEDVVVRALQKVYSEYSTESEDEQGGINCNDSEDAWALSIPLSDGSTHWCVDSSLNARGIGDTIEEGIWVCPAS